MSRRAPFLLLVTASLGLVLAGCADAGDACPDETCGDPEACTSCPEGCGRCPPADACGDGACGPSETCETCAPDCGACPPGEVCGDAACAQSESCGNCPEDCGGCPVGDLCGDATCAESEGCASCPNDCGECPAGDVCGDGTCADPESCTSCAQDCGDCLPEERCGDGRCAAATESCTSCPEDCGACPVRCGDKACAAAESCLSCPGDCGACPAGAVDIWFPRGMAPQFATAGGSFSAEVRGASGLAAGKWCAQVSNDLRRWDATVTAASYGKIDHGSEQGWRLTVELPAGVPPELLDLEVAHGAVGTGKSARAVQVVRNFEESFYILHQTDHHVVSQDAANPDGSAPAGNLVPGTVDGMKWGAKTINVINPRFVVATGDNTLVYFDDNYQGAAAARARLGRLARGFSSYDVATVVTTGNHDMPYPGAEQVAAYKDLYAEVIGPRAMSYRLGSFYLLAHEWTQPQYATWARNDWADAFADPKLKFRLVATHYHGGANAVASAARPASLELVGHIHEAKVVRTTPFRVLASPMAKSWATSSVFQFNRTATGWSCPQTKTFAVNVNIFPMHGDNGAPKVTETFAKANDGTQTSNKVTVVNSLPFNFWHGRAKFLMAKGRYTVTGGKVEATYDDAAGTRTAVLVRVNIPKSGQVVASIAPAP